MELFIRLIGLKGLVGLLGFIIFSFSFKYAQGIFQWIESQTLGTRTYIMERLDFLFIEVKPDHVTYSLLFLSAGVGSFTFLIFTFLGHWVMGLFLGGMLSFLGFKAPKPFINILVNKRIQAYQDQMVDGLTLLSNGIRAGLSVPQAIGMVVSEMPDPISQEFNIILQQNNIGVPLEECFDNLATRIPIEDNDMFVSGVNILRETGGNLAETFDTIVGVIRERVRLQQKIDTYVAQGMFQGMTIFFMPFGIGGIYYLSDPDSMIPLFTTPIGLIAVIFALILDLTGGAIIMKIVKIKV